MTYGNVEIVLDTRKLKMTFSHHPNLYAALHPLSDSRFYAVFTDPDFGRNVFPFKVENGKVKSVTVKVSGEDTPNVFIKQNK